MIDFRCLSSAREKAEKIDRQFGSFAWISLIRGRVQRVSRVSSGQMFSNTENRRFL